MLDKELLLKYGAKEQELSKGEFLFREGEHARYYYEVLEGEVIINNYTHGGKEFIQGIFSAGRGFGEPSLFDNDIYPVNAIAAKNSRIIKIYKDKFFQLLKENFSAHLAITKALAERMNYKAIISAEMASNPPEERVITLLNYLKHDIYKIEKPFAYQVELTRQQIADLTGLRVETVIKTIKELERQGELKIENRKVLI